MNKWKRIVASLLVLALFFGFLPLTALPSRAAEIYELPAVGDEAYIDITKATTTIYRSDTGKAYVRKSDGGHPLRMYVFAYDTNEKANENQEYNPEQVMYCIQYGVNLPSSEKYISCNPDEVSTWTAWSQTAKEGIMLMLGFGFPNSTLSELRAATDDDAVAATQILVWEFEKGYRTSLTGSADNTTLFDDYLKGTPAEAIYWRILGRANSFKSSSEYQYSDLTNTGRFRIWRSKGDSNAQLLMGFQFDDEPGEPYHETGRIEIHKVDPNGRDLSGARFKVYNSVSKKTYYIGPTDKNGYAKSDEITISKNPEENVYTVTETVFPTGFEPNPGETYEWTVTLDGVENNQIWIEAENYERGVITIDKTVTGGTDADKKGWLFDIYNSDWKYVETVETDVNGVATTSRLLAGKYYVVESGNTDPEKWNGEYWELDINSKTGGSLNLLRNASLTEETLGYNYAWYGGDNTKLEYVTFDGQKCLYMADPTTNTSKQDIASFRQARIRLTAGTYTFSGKVYAEEDRTVRISIYDNSTGKFTRIANAYSFNAKAGWNDFSFTFQTFYTNDEQKTLCDLAEAYLAVEVFDSVESGVYLAQPKLEPGTKATEWSDSYRGTEVTLTKNGVTLTSQNSKNLQLTIRKTVPDGEILEGWIFDVYDKHLNFVETMTTDATGVATSSYLPYGSYYVKEAGHVDPTVLSTGEWLLDINSDHGGTINLLRNAAMVMDDLDFSQSWYSSDDSVLEYVSFDGFDSLYRFWRKVMDLHLLPNCNQM